MTVNRQSAAHFVALHATLGEGAVWDARLDCFWCVDIDRPAVHRFSPDGARLETWPAPTKIGWIVPHPDGRILVGLVDGIYRFRADAGTFEQVQPIEIDLPENRLNDATVDADGTIWLGTMDDRERRSTGRYYRYDGKLSLCSIPSAIITNGPAISPDGRTLYTVDTLAGVISAHSIGQDGVLKAVRNFARIASRDGYPDGVTCDCAGGLWLALWGGWSARRYDSTGSVTHEVRFPVANVTKVALGGSDGRTAFVTTARKGLSVAELNKQPLAGDVFTFRAAISL